MKNKIYYTKPSITELEVEYVHDAIKNGWGEKCYDYIYSFQGLFGDFLGSDFALATSSCTGALHLALKSIGIKTGDEVIVPDATWVASVAPITYLSANPVFVDVMEDTWCIDPTKLEAAITPNTKAIIVVHLYGNMCDMDSILAIAKKHNLYVIEDAAEAIGSEYKGKKAGTMGDFGVFSFHGTKTITTGEGGMLVTNNPQFYEKSSILNNHGRDPKINKIFWAEKVGFKYKMSNLQAALGCAQLERIECLIEKRIEIFNWYKEYLLNYKNIVAMNIELNGVKNSYWMPTIILGEDSPIERDALVSKLNESNIDARPFFHRVSSFPEFETNHNNTVSAWLSKRGLNLPSYFDLTQNQVELIADTVKALI